MSTIRLYKEDVYRKEAAARITSVCEKNGHALVTLDQTLFFPEGGGQSCDQGTLAGFEVLDVQEKDGEVYHLVDCQCADLPKPDENCEVELILDWNHRFDNMQRHCGEHIVSGAFFREYGGVNRGFHMGDQYMTLDISLESDPAYDKVTWEMAEHIERCANQVIWSGAPVITRHFDTFEEASQLPLRKALAIDEDITIVSIGDPDSPADCVACCGTHPKNAAEVGMIKIYKVESNKGLFRIYMEAGQRAFRRYQQEYDVLTDLGSRLSAGTEDLMKKYLAQQEKAAEVRQQLGQLRRYVIGQEAQKIRACLSTGASGASAAPAPGGSTRNPAFYYDILTVDDLLNLAKELQGAIPSVLFLVHRPSHTVLLCSDGEPHCGRLVKENASIYGGKGGGSAVTARAIFQKEEYVDTFIDLIDKHLR